MNLEDLVPPPTIGDETWRITKPGIYLNPKDFNELCNRLPALYPCGELVWQGVRVRPSRFVPAGKFLEVEDHNGVTVCKWGNVGDE